MTYSEAYYTERESWRDWRIEAHELMRLAGVRSGANILEIGCGGGGLLQIIAAHGARAVGVETQWPALELARQRADPQHRIEVMLTGADGTLPFAPQAFDAIVAQHVVEHLPDTAALTEWTRVLKPGGHLALATPNGLYPDPEHFADADHARVFTPASLRTAVAQAGLDVESCSTIFPYLLSLRVLRAAGVIGYRAFQKAPHFSARGRTILLSARKPG